MPNKCIVRGCNGRGGFTFPSDPELNSKWQSAINRATATPSTSSTVSWIPTMYSTVCESHFKQDDFKGSIAPEGQRTRRVLKKNVVPSIFVSSSPAASSSSPAAAAASSSNVINEEVTVTTPNPVSALTFVKKILVMIDVFPACMVLHFFYKLILVAISIRRENIRTSIQY